MAPDAPPNHGHFSCSSIVLRCCDWLDKTWLGIHVKKIDACVGRTWVYRGLMAFLCLQPPLDLLTDLQQIWFFSSEGWWLSLAVAATVWYASVRFGFIYAATQARPAPFCRIVVLYVPGLLLPFWETLTKEYAVDKPGVGARLSRSLSARRHAKWKAVGAPLSADSNQQFDHDAPCEDDTEQPQESPCEHQHQTLDAPCTMVDVMMISMEDIPFYGDEESKEAQPCIAQSLRQHHIRESPFNGSRIPQKTYNVIKAFVFKYKEPRDHHSVSYDDLGLNPFTALALPIIFVLFLLFSPLYMLEALCAKIAGRDHDLYAKESSSVVVKFLINLTFELWLVLPAMFLGTYLLVCASTTLACESLMPGQNTDIQKKHKLYSRVITFIEGVLESTPQLLLQSITFWFAVKSGNTEPFFGIPYDTMFTVSAACSIAGILKAAWSFYRNNKDIIMMLVPPTRREDVLPAVQHDGRALRSADSVLKKDKEVVLAAVRQNGLALTHADAQLKKDEDIVLAAVRQNGLALKYADAELKKDEGVVLAALQQDGKALCFADAKLKHDKQFVLAAVRQNGLALKFAGAELKKDEEVVIAALQQDGKALYFTDAALKREVKVVLVALKQDWRALEFVDTDLKKNKEVILAVLQQDERAPEVADAKLKKDKDFVLVTLQQDGKQPELAEAKLKKDKEFVFDALQHDCLAALKFADTELKKDKEIILAAVRIDGRALEFAAIKLKKDIEIVLTAVQQDWQALQFAEPNLKKDKTVALAAVQQDWHSLKFADTILKEDKEVVLAAVQQDGRAIEFAGTKLKHDTEVALAAVQKDWQVLKFAGTKLKKDEQVVFAAVRQDGRALEFAGTNLKKHKKVVLAAVQKDGRALQFADASLKKDKTVVLAAVQQDGSALEFAHAKLKNDEDVVLAANAPGATL